MSGPERDTPDDTLLEEFLDGRSEISKTYRAGAQPGAPPVLDDPVLKIARDAQGHPVIVDARPRPARRWRLPLALAATMVLGIGIVRELQQDRAAYEAAFEMAPAPKSAAPASPPAEADADVEAQTPAPVAAEREAARELAQARQRAAEPPMRREQDPAAKTLPPAADEMKREPAADAVSPDRSAALAAGEARPQQRTESRKAPQALAARPAPAADARATPEEWFAQMRVLRDDGRIDEARQMLYAFSSDYPDQELPEDLRALEPPPAPASPSSSDAP